MPLKFRKVLIADERYETAGVFDVNGDGRPDIVSGAYWYEGPGFRKAHFALGRAPAPCEASEALEDLQVARQYMLIRQES